MPGHRAVAAARAAAALCVLALATSCTVHEVKEPVAPVAVPETFTSTGVEAVPDRWWEAFGDPELNRLVGEALGRNLDLRVAWDRLDQSVALARQAGAAQWPSLDAVGRAGVTRAKTDRSGAGKSTDTTEDYMLGLQVSYEVDLWGRIRSVRRAAELGVTASEADVVTTAMLLAARVAITYYELIQQRATLTLLEEQLKTSETLLQLVELRFQQGTVGSVDVFQQRRQLESVKGQVPVARMRAAVLENQLAVLLGRPPEDKVATLPPAIPDLPPAPATGVPAALVQRRPDLRAAHARVAAADYRVAAAVADRFPALRLSGRVETGGTKFSDLFDLWLAGLVGNVAQPLIDGGFRAAEVERTRAVVAERLHGYGQSVLVALQEVEDALVQEQHQREFWRNVAGRAEIAGKEMERARQRYAYGVTDYLPVLAAIQAQQGLARQALEEERKLVQYRIDLYRALGGGWELARPPDPPADPPTAEAGTEQPNNPATTSGQAPLDRS